MYITGTRLKTGTAVSRFLQTRLVQTYTLTNYRCRKAAAKRPTTAGDMPSTTQSSQTRPQPDLSTTTA